MVKRQSRAQRVIAEFAAGKDDEQLLAALRARNAGSSRSRRHEAEVRALELKAELLKLEVAAAQRALKTAGQPEIIVILERDLGGDA